MYERSLDHLLMAAPRDSIMQTGYNTINRVKRNRMGVNLTGMLRKGLKWHFTQHASLPRLDFQLFIRYLKCHDMSQTT